MDHMTLGNKIKSLRKSMKMTQKELAGDFITRNMLSRIENDSATPSMKTMEYLAMKLDKPIGYFVDKGHDEVSLSHFIARLMASNEKGNYEEGITLLEEGIERNPQWAQNSMVMDLYANTYMYLGNRYYEKGMYEEAKEAFQKILSYEQNLILAPDVYLYKVYDRLAETYAQLGEMEEAKNFTEKSKELIGRLAARRDVQSLYIQMMDGDDEAVVNQLSGIDTSYFDPYSKARFHMIAGTSYYRNQQYEEAIPYMEKSLEYYRQHTYSTVTIMLYENISKCYSELGQYKKAYFYLQTAQELQQRPHNRG